MGSSAAYRGQVGARDGVPGWFYLSRFDLELGVHNR